MSDLTETNAYGPSLELRSVKISRNLCHNILQAPPIDNGRGPLTLLGTSYGSSAHNA